MTLLKTLDELDELDGKRVGGKWDSCGERTIVTKKREDIGNGCVYDGKGIAEFDTNDESEEEWAEAEINRDFVIALANNWPKISKAMRSALRALQAVDHSMHPQGSCTICDAKYEINALFSEANVKLEGK